MPARICPVLEAFSFSAKLGGCHDFKADHESDRNPPKNTRFVLNALLNGCAMLIKPNPTLCDPSRDRPLTRLCENIISADSKCCSDA